ncbi:MAG: MmgE/PrpD family protein, partial [Acidobacteriaceae bacterium]
MGRFGDHCRRTSLSDSNCSTGAWTVRHSESRWFRHKSAQQLYERSSPASGASGGSGKDKTSHSGHFCRNDFRLQVASGSARSAVYSILRWQRSLQCSRFQYRVRSHRGSPLANGILAHADETDDSNSPSQSHPGCGVVPAALAAGEQFHITGTHFIRAVALGYDIGPRVTITLGGQQFEAESHWSTHSISPLFGAAAAAGCAARLDAQQMRWMLGY